MNKIKRVTAVICSLLFICLLTANGLTEYVSAATIKVATKSIELTVNQTSKIVINNKNKKATYTFKSTDKAVATVNKSGVVKAVAEGTTTITVSSTLKKKVSKVGTVKVTVKAKAVATATPTATPTVAPTVAPSTGDAKLDGILQRALLSTGNNTRIKKAIEKARKGETVTIAYIGGSITEGASALPNSLCYANRTYEYFKKTYGKGDGSNVKFVNAGMGGTPSTLGMIRYNRDVIQVGGGNPDIVFVEFAVNDYGDPTKGEGYESLVRNILKSDNQPAVILLFSIFQSKWNEQARLKPIGDYYQLPMVSIYNGILPLLNSGEMKDEEFFAKDGYHPINEGHALYAQCINYMFDTIDKEPVDASDYAIPDAPKIGKSFEGIQMIDTTTSSSDYTIEKGSFSGVDKNMIGFGTPSKLTFPNNWMHTSSSGSDSMKVTLTCKNFVIVYKNSNNKAAAGKIDVYVDGTKTKTIDSGVNGGWNQALNMVIFNNATAAKHEIEIKMADDSSSKEFTIQAIGYTR